VPFIESELVVSELSDCDRSELAGAEAVAGGALSREDIP